MIRDCAMHRNGTLPTVSWTESGNGALMWYREGRGENYEDTSTRSRPGVVKQLVRSPAFARVDMQAGLEKRSAQRELVRVEIDMLGEAVVDRSLPLVSRDMSQLVCEDSTEPRQQRSSHRRKERPTSLVEEEVAVVCAIQHVGREAFAGDLYHLV